MIRIRRALLSVSDKTGLVDFARVLAGAGAELISTGGTARSLSEAGLPVVQVSDVTGFPECLGGRVKTLHPSVHGGILYRRDEPDHVRQIEDLGIEPVDLVCVNLYPFERTVASKGVTRPEGIEQIDIGGPAMLRSAAKNHAHVVVITDAADYAAVAAEIREQGGVSEESSARLAAKAFTRTSRYDAAIAAWLSEGESLSVSGHRAFGLRYGENPHQAAEAFVVNGERGGVLQARLRQGKELSYNNLADLDAAWTLARDLAPAGCAIIKHANPCGAAEAATTTAALSDARACDPVSAFGGIYAFNERVDEDTAHLLLESFVECVIAPGYSEAALAAFAAKKAVRVLEGELPPCPRDGREWKRINGGFLVQDWDDIRVPCTDWRVVTKRAPTQSELAALDFAWRVVRHVKSNAILFARQGRTVGVGAGQMSRVDSVDIAVLKAARSGLSLAGSVVASDAFFPFRDGLDRAAEAGATAVVHPGGSRRDDEVIAAADEHGIAMLHTSHRHFRH